MFGAFGWAVCLGYWLVVSEEGESGQTKKAHLSVSLFAKSGAGTRSRTRDLLITIQLLYQLSYTGVVGADYRDLISRVKP